MRDFDAIRGKKPTKTDMILEYLLNHPNEMLTPKEVSDGLGFNLQTTVTVLNRLALEGAISKKGRGQFCFVSEGKRKLGRDEVEVKGVDEKAPSKKIDNKTAVTIYKAIYDMASESMGAGVVGSVTGLNMDDFDEKAPIESIKNLVRGLIDLLGKEIADDIVSIALESELTRDETLKLKQMLEA